MIAVDAMGGDNAPHVIIQGVLHAASNSIPITIFGDQVHVESILEGLNSDWRLLPISIEHCSQTVTMDEVPSKAVLRKKDASLIRAIQAVADGKASAVVSAGNSGAVLIASTLIIGRTPNVLRPAIGTFLPTKKGSIYCLDVGANTDCKPEFLEQFAYMGHIYTQLVKDIPIPRVALLSNGHEPNKGSILIKQAYKRLSK